jgi:hypothetical protein
MVDCGVPGRLVVVVITVSGSGSKFRWTLSLGRRISTSKFEPDLLITLSMIVGPLYVPDEELSGKDVDAVIVTRHNAHALKGDYSDAKSSEPSPPFLQAPSLMMLYTGEYQPWPFVHRVL